MRTSMRALVVFVGALLASLPACHSEQVVKAASCSEPCCSGHPGLVDCGENRDLSCVESGDPCTAQAFGCAHGVFFERAQDPLPAACSAADGGPDATTDNEPDGGLFTSGDATAPDAMADSPGAPDGALDGASADEPEGATDAATLFACGDASCSVVSQYCRRTVGGAPPGVGTQVCQPLGQGQSTCAPDAASGACQCSEDGGGLYVQCDVP